MIPNRVAGRVASHVASHVAGVIASRDTQSPYLMRLGFSMVSAWFLSL